MLYALLQLLALSLPGGLLVLTLGIARERYLFIVALSYAYYALIAAVSIWQHWTTNASLTIYLGGLVLLAILALLRLLFVSRCRSLDSAEAGLNHSLPLLLGGFAVVLAYVLYRSWAGPYLEMPADVYQHLEYARAQLHQVEAGYLNRQHSLLSVLGQRGGIWYSLYAWLSHLSATDFRQSLPLAMLINGAVFLSAIYAFSLFLARQLANAGANSWPNGGAKALANDGEKKWIFSLNQQIAVSMLAAFFVAAHMGINVMSYLRYYAFAPTMLNMVLYFAGLICVLQLLGSANESKIYKLRYIGLFLFLGLAAAVIHTQEALFLAMMTLLILMAHVLLAVINQDGQAIAKRVKRLFKTWSMWFLLLGLLLALGVEVWVYLNHERPTALFGKVLQLSESGPIANRIFYLNPDFQFIRVVTIWGLLVSVLFVWQIKRFRASAYLLAGMFSPLLTVFNPFFVDFFLRLDGPHTLWRMLYIVPFHFTAAYLVLIFIKKTKEKASGKLSMLSTLLKKIPAVAAILLLFLLLLPIQFGAVSNAYSRLTLKPVTSQNDYTLWQDLFDFLNQQPGVKRILTDPVTGYAIQGLSPHYSYRYKFLPVGNYQRYRLDFDDYSDKPLAQYKGWWIIVNDRQGANSLTGEMARHWPADIMQVSKYYGPALRQHLQGNPERFSVLWSAEDIHVYEIR